MKKLKGIGITLIIVGLGAFYEQGQFSLHQKKFPASEISFGEGFFSGSK